MTTRDSIARDSITRDSITRDSITRDSIASILCRQSEERLSPYACRESASRGRERPLAPSELRGEFQRDRDRIIHCKAFRRLMHKTQVFLAPEQEHYRTRLTHTLEVTQIARTMARALSLNEDLCEAAALGHDLGHTPFGHIGEDALRQCYSKDFAHYRQSLRVVEKLENEGQGLNLTWEVRDGIVNHQGEHLAATLEGRLVKFADRIAYINHDIDDAIRAGLLREDDIPARLRDVLGDSHSRRIDTMVTSVVRQSLGKPEIAMEPHLWEATGELRAFLFERVYYSPPVLAEEERAKTLLIRLFDYYVAHPDRMPAFYVSLTEREPVERCVADFISGMTDRHAIRLYKDLFIPNTWSGRVE
ncbi:MAG: deoxyguanosinetriphosphate triphosphohydrolase [Clostridia bacterium]|nr:deoxyguanosinetriphosphate triphosphohydrolase [Clostridia bacterium]